LEHSIHGGEESRSTVRGMETTQRGGWYWAPRILSLLFAGFTGLFALDVFQGHPSPGEALVALLMHLIPTGIVLLILAAAWRWEWVGAAAFPALGLLYLVTAWGRFHWSAYAVIAGPLFLLGILFLIAWRHGSGSSSRLSMPA